MNDTLPFFAKIGRDLVDALSDEEGSVAILFGLMAIPLFVALGMAIDYSRAASAHTALQAATDAAALGGASAGGDDAQKLAVAENIFAANFNSAQHGNASPQVTVDNGFVSVNATASVETTLTKLAYIDTMTLSANASAQISESGAIACLLALDPSGDKAIHVQGNNDLELENCWAWANSSNSAAIHGVGNATATADGFCAVGSHDDHNNYSPTPQSGCDVIPDPYADITWPSSTGCDYNNKSLKKGTYTLSPGVYCGGLELKPHANVTFLPGTYVMKDGPLKFQAQTTATGANVLFYFNGDDATLVVKGGASVDFIGRSPGESHEGFLFIQHPDAAPGETTEIWGGGSVIMDGVLYMPTQTVEIRGNGSINAQASMWAMVAHSFYLRGNGTFYLNADPEGAGLPDILPRVPSKPARLGS